MSPYSSYFIKDGYCSQVPGAQEDPAINISQPDGYRLARMLADHSGTVIDLGCGKGYKLRSLLGSKDVVGVDTAHNIAHCKSMHTIGTWVAHDLEQPLDDDLLSGDRLKDVTIICADVIEHLYHPEHLMRSLARLLDFGGVGVISTPERDLTYGSNHRGPPPNPCHAREWNRVEFVRFLKTFGLFVEYCGLTINHQIANKFLNILAVVSRRRRAVHPQDWWDRNYFTSANDYEIWYGPTEAKLHTRRHVVNNGYQSLLDCGCGYCSEYYGYREIAPSLNYMGFDSCRAFVERARGAGVPVTHGSMETMPFPDKSYDVVFSSCVLEHLPGYEEALLEMIRVARREVINVFFIRPGETEAIQFGIEDNLYNNLYSRNQLCEFLSWQPRVKDYHWQPAGDKEVLHVALV